MICSDRHLRLRPINGVRSRKRTHHPDEIIAETFAGRSNLPTRGSPTTTGSAATLTVRTDARCTTLP